MAEIPAISATVSGSNQSDAPIKSVSVFPSHAQITRIWTKTLQPGVHHIRFTNFYQEYLARSLRVEIDGAAVITDVSETPSSDFATSSSRMPAAQTRLQDLQRQKREAETQLVFAEKRLEIWEAYRQVVMGAAQGPPAMIFKEGAFTDLHDFLWKYEGEFIRLHTVLTQTRATLAATEDAIARHLDSASPVSCKVSDIKIVINATAAGSIKLNIVYNVKEAGWSAKYDIRILSAEKTAEVAYYATIQQWTGEDWNEADITVIGSSFTQSHYCSHAANGKVEYCVRQIWPAKFVTGDNHVAVDKEQKVTNIHKPTKSVQPSRVPSLESLATEPADTTDVKNKRLVLHYNETNVDHKDVTVSCVPFSVHLPKVLSVPHEKATQVTLSIWKLDAEYEYKCFPRRDMNTYVKVKLHNRSNLTMLPGMANLFYSGNFVDHVCLHTVHPLDTFMLNVGADKSVEVIPKPSVKTTKPTGANMNEANYHVEAEFIHEYDIKNNKKHPVVFTFRENVPKSTDPRVKVTVMHPVLHKHDLEIGIIKQRIDIPPSTTRAIRIIYKVEHPHTVRFAENYITI